MNPLGAVDATSELASRPARTPDPAAENRALVAIAERMGDGPKGVLETLVQLALALCRADSAGVSIAEDDGGVPVHFRSSHWCSRRTPCGSRR